MKSEFIDILTKKLIAQKDFVPLKNEEGVLAIGDKINIMVKNSYGSTIIVELINGDALTSEEIRERLEQNSKVLSEMPAGLPQYFFEIFVFDIEPEKEKVDIISSGQFQSFMGKKYLSCFSVSLFNNSINRFFKLPLTDLGLSKIIKQVMIEGNSQPEENQSIEEIIASKEKEYELKFEVNTPVLTYALIVINILAAVLIFLYSIYTGVSYNELLIPFGAKENYRIISGEYWRFVTPIFLHGGLVHLLLNCYSLYAVGVAVEKLFGRTRFLFIYIVSGILGNIASFMFSYHPGVGASGAIFGLLGTLLFFGIYRPAIFRKYFGSGVITIVIINLLYGLSNEGIDNFAHMGGLVGGFIASGIAAKPEKKKWYLNRVLYLLLAVIITFSGLYGGFNSKQNKIYVLINELIGLETAQNWSEIEEKAEEILELEPEKVELKAITLRSLATAQFLSGKVDEAQESAKELIAIDPKEGHYILGAIYFELQEYELAKEELLESRKAGNKDERIEQLLDEIEKVE